MSIERKYVKKFINESEKPSTENIKEYIMKAIEQLPDNSIKLNEYAPREDGSYSFIEANVKLGDSVVSLVIRNDGQRYFFV